MQQDQSKTRQNTQGEETTDNGKTGQKTAGADQPQLVEQKGEIKNNDQDPGAGNRSLANEGGEKP